MKDNAVNIQIILLLPKQQSKKVIKMVGKFMFNKTLLENDFITLPFN